MTDAVRFTNPVLAGDRPDPAVIRVGHEYWMTYSSFQAAPGLPLYRSTDLVNWTFEGSALPRPLGNTFAVDIAEHDGHFFIYIPFIPAPWSELSEPSIFVIHAPSMPSPCASVRPSSLLSYPHMDSPPRDDRRRAADLMTEAVPRAAPGDSVARSLSMLREGKLEEAGHLYLVDEQGRLLGQVPVERLLAARPEQVLADLQGPPPLEVNPDDVAESAALLAVERHEADVTVVDERRRLLGAIPIGRLLALLHEEHVDDLLRKGGVGSVHPAPTEPHSTIDAFRARIPWLILGLVGGWVAAGIAGAFEAALQQEIALAFFLPLVVYMADAIGTQTETILVRRMVYGRVALLRQLWREALLGLLMGLTIGAAAWIGLWLVDGRGRVATIVALTILCSSIVATLIASFLPWVLDRLGVDPAMASGPVATVLQDLLSVAIYLGIATVII